MLKTLRCIMGPGRWNAEALAEELECSVRTVQRILQTLTMAGVPFRYDSERRSYEVQPGFKFPGLETSRDASCHAAELAKLRSKTKQVIADGEAFLDSLRTLCDVLQEEPSIR